MRPEPQYLLQISSNLVKNEGSIHWNLPRIQLSKSRPAWTWVRNRRCAASPWSLFPSKSSHRALWESLSIYPRPQFPAKLPRFVKILHFFTRVKRWFFFPLDCSSGSTCRFRLMNPNFCSGDRAVVPFEASPSAISVACENNQIITTAVQIYSYFCVASWCCFRNCIMMLFSELQDVTKTIVFGGSTKIFCIRNPTKLTLLRPSSVSRHQWIRMSLWCDRQRPKIKIWKVFLCPTFQRWPTAGNQLRKTSGSIRIISSTDFHAEATGTRKGKTLSPQVFAKSSNFLDVISYVESWTLSCGQERWRIALQSVVKDIRNQQILRHCRTKVEKRNGVIFFLKCSALSTNSGQFRR